MQSCQRWHLARIGQRPSTLLDRERRCQGHPRCCRLGSGHERRAGHAGERSPQHKDLGDVEGRGLGARIDDEVKSNKALSGAHAARWARLKVAAIGALR
eukprot:scaffold478_cov254-Pinguiococcus_pyrenoidosus.AAC.7